MGIMAKDMRLAVPLCLCLALPALAQDSRITGQITDAGRSAVATVIVTATNVDSGSTRAVLSSPHGYFQFAQLTSGNYRLEAVKPGYKPLSHSAVGVGQGRTTTVELQMESARVSETVALEGRKTATGSLIAYLCNVSPGSGCEMLDIADASSDVAGVRLLLP
jgi:Carboxypeptidase regulatory-like domain